MQARYSLTRKRSSSWGSAPWSRIYSAIDFVRDVPAGAHEVATCPQVPTPELRPQPSMILEEMMGRLPLDRLHDTARREVRRDTQQQMDVVGPDVPLQNLDVLRFDRSPESNRAPLGQYHRGAPACDTS